MKHARDIVYRSHSLVRHQIVGDVHIKRLEEVLSKFFSLLSDLSDVEVRRALRIVQQKIYVINIQQSVVCVLDGNEQRLDSFVGSAVADINILQVVVVVNGK